MREILYAVHDYLREPVGGQPRFDKRVAEIAAAWGVAVEAPRGFGVGFDASGQFPAVAVLPQTQLVNWTDGFYSLAREFQVVIGIAAGDLEHGVVLNTLLAYNSAVEQLLAEDETLGARVTSARMTSAEFSSAVHEQKFYQTIDITIKVIPKPKVSEQI
jgi:hypothetical protein